MGIRTKTRISRTQKLLSHWKQGFCKVLHRNVSMGTLENSLLSESRLNNQLSQFVNKRILGAQQVLVIWMQMSLFVVFDQLLDSGYSGRRVTTILHINPLHFQNTTNVLDAANFLSAGVTFPGSLSCERRAWKQEARTWWSFVWTFPCRRKGSKFRRIAASEAITWKFIRRFDRLESLCSSG